jgi:polysaccharide biosynthesis protein PslH
VTVIGAVPDVADYYRAADAVIIPLRAGGGTRIKLLEAFSYRRSVVSTALGAEGIEVRHGIHLFIADTPGDFAQQCLRLMQTPALGVELAGQAFEFVRYNHSPERIRELLRQDHRA